MTVKSKYSALLLILLFVGVIAGSFAYAEQQAELPKSNPIVHDLPPGTETGISEYNDLHLLMPPVQENKRPSTADHAQFKALQGPFDNGSQVTQACLGCHNQAGEQFMHSIHWTWQYEHPETGQMLGKKTLINNFCTNARGNEGMCSQCHAAYNHTSFDFDYSNPLNIDCLVCHEQTGTYYRSPSTAGSAACSTMFEGKEPINWAKVAQSVANPQRRNCGLCHFFGGGGDNVKHGDLSSALIAPDKMLDVHMDQNGLNFTCQECHQTIGHITAGSRYEMLSIDALGEGLPGIRRHAASCESCHGNEPHDELSPLMAMKLNSHTNKVACATCHIPEFARGGVATKTHWDWRTSGKLDKNGQGFKLKEYTQGNGEHRATYKSIKGDFKYDENIVPEYAWFDGTMDYTTIDTVFDPETAPIEINGFKGSYNDPKSRIWPFKRMDTIMPYDKLHNTLVYMHLWGEDDSAYWGNYDMQKAIEYGMKEADKNFSGEYGFIETYSYWPITHMVPPAENALQCSECHSHGGRLENLKGFYMPGRDSWWWLDLIGIMAIVLSGVLAIGHAIMRYVMHKKNEAKN